ncbi:hypothetical protein GCM10027046_36440 [Uliginosibacterium flavum]|uniref:Uncharacterized protein n=1 Tax=Uliginosibacterium flavum TaxID=1396831 RepID=A0ABV2TM90_9RHOO
MKDTQAKSAVDKPEDARKESTRKTVYSPSRETVGNFEAGARKAQVAFAEALKKIRQTDQGPQK